MRSRYWEIRQLRRHAAIIQGLAAPSKVLLNATYLNTYLKTWEKANIWIDSDRIVYVGKRLPIKIDEETEQTDCEGYTLVPGYIEPHVHVNLLYNPQTLAAYAANLGTTTLVCDNAVLFNSLDDEQSFQLIDKLDQLPTTFFWWCRYDSQSETVETLFTDERVRRWLNHPLVIQGGELTAWPQVLHGDDQILSWMRETKVLGKPIESHLPGASEKTLTQLKLLGADCDHEAMTGEEAITRLRLGYTASLRYSSIRPDLPDILKTMVEKGVHSFEHAYMTMDGATPAFLREGVVDRLIRIAIDQGIDEKEAYMMASSNIAAHYGLNDRLGHIAPGRLAHINFLHSPAEPRPAAVLAKGQWIRKHGEKKYDYFSSFDIADRLGGFSVPFTLDEADLKAETPLGLDMVDAVISRPFEITVPSGDGALPENTLYLSLVGRTGQWIVNSYVRGFADLPGFATSYSCTGDLILMGKNKSDMLAALERLKKIGGGMVIVENGTVTSEIALPLLGFMSAHKLDELMEEAGAFTHELRKRGYKFADPFFSLLFLSSTHLPYIRITPQGLFDVMRRKQLFPNQPLKKS